MTHYGYCAHHDSVTPHICGAPCCATPTEAQVQRDANRSLTDLDQGVCPEGHRCALSTGGNARVCSGTERYVGLPLVRWDVTEAIIAEATGADPELVAWARSFLDERMCPVCYTPDGPEHRATPLHDKRQGEAWDATDDLED